jgi:hypothetical protein
VSGRGGSSDAEAGNAAQPEGATVRPQIVTPDEAEGSSDAVAVEAQVLARRTGDPAAPAVETDGWPGPIDEPPPLWA